MHKFLLVVPFSVACIVIDDNEKHYDDWEWDTGKSLDEEQDQSDDENDENGQDVPDEQDQQDDEQDTPNDETPLEDHNISYTLIPHAGTPGSTFVTSITVDEGQEIDWLSIEQITAFGNLTICNHQPLYDRILLTIQIPEDAQEAPVDFLVQYTDGDVDLIEDAFYIDEEFDLSSALVSPDECSE